MAKSIYLSTGRYAGLDEPEGWRSELAQLQRSLKSGQKVSYNEAELARTAATKEAFRRAPPSSAWNTVLRFFMPGVLLIAVIWLLVWLLRTLRQ
jgi:hypothetical protein